MTSLSDILTPSVLSRLGEYSLMARTAVEGYLAGIHRSTSRGFGGEFVQYRPHVPGDDLKYVDWKLYARQDKVYQKVFQEETDMRCAIMVDASASMAYKGTEASCTKYEYAAMIAACFAYLACSQGDRPGVFVYSDDMKSATPNGQRTPRLPQLLKILEGVTPAGEAAHEAALLRAGSYLGPQRGLLVWITDLWGTDESLERMIRRIHFEKRDCLVCHVLDNDEIELPFGDTRRFVDCESGDSITTAPEVVRPVYRERMASYLDGVRKTCLSNQSDYFLARTKESLGECLSAYLHRREAMVK